MTKLIDKLLKKAKEMVAETLFGSFTFDYDGFIEALGLNKENYKVAIDPKTGEPLYDADKALNDSCKLVDWDEV